MKNKVRVEADIDETSSPDTISIGLTTTVGRLVSMTAQEFRRNCKEIIAAAIFYADQKRNDKLTDFQIDRKRLFSNSFIDNDVKTIAGKRIKISGAALDILLSCVSSEHNMAQAKDDDPSLPLKLALSDLVKELKGYLEFLELYLKEPAIVSISLNEEDGFQIELAAEDLSLTIKETIVGALFYAYCCYQMDYEDEEVKKNKLYDNEFSPFVLEIEQNKIEISGKAANFLLDLVICDDIAQQCSEGDLAIPCNTAENALLHAVHDFVPFLVQPN